MGFWTRVRLPSGPLTGMPENAMFWAFQFRNFIKMSDLDVYEGEKYCSNMCQRVKKFWRKRDRRVATRLSLLLCIGLGRYAFVILLVRENNKVYLNWYGSTRSITTLCMF